MSKKQKPPEHAMAFSIDVTKDYADIDVAANSLVNAIVTGLSQPRARSRTFTAKQCTACTAIRLQDAATKPEDNFSRVIATRGNIRYCRCYYCGNTWKDSDVVPLSGI